MDLSKKEIAMRGETNCEHWVQRLAAVVLTLLFCGAALASDGVHEINQVCAVNTGCFAGDTPGFPVTIAGAGSYRLTSDLLVTTDVGGIVVGANDVSIDLNGFLIDGPSLCAPIACPTGSSDGIGASGAFVGQRVRVRNGTVTGFSGACVSLSTLAHVSDLSIQSCGGVGIRSRHR